MENGARGALKMAGFYPAHVTSRYDSNAISNYKQDREPYLNKYK